jgi:hypothetical protein
VVARLLGVVDAVVVGEAVGVDAQIGVLLKK